MTDEEDEELARELFKELYSVRGMNTVSPDALRGDAYGDWWIQNETGVKKLLAELDDCDLCEIVCADSLGALVSAAKTLRTKLRRDIRAAMGQTDMEDPEPFDEQFEGGRR